MKVGTDGVLLGALAEGGERILDIGTGTALVALMMAQRFASARITAIDIDADAVAQARDNVDASPFAGRIDIQLADFTAFPATTQYDSIVCNPPFFEDSLECPDAARSKARHAASLPFSALISKAAQLLTPDGRLTLIIPTDSMGRIEEECAYATLFIHKRLFIHTVERKAPKRVILFIAKAKPDATVTEHQSLMRDNERTTWYADACKEFYL